MDTNVLKFVVGVVVVLAAWPVAWASGLLSSNSPAWRNTLVCAAWGAAFVMTVILLLPGFDARPFDIGVAAFTGALGGVITGLGWSFSDFLERQREKRRKAGEETRTTPSN